jgi:hypothetical protein
MDDNDEFEILEIIGALDAHAAEALRLQIHRLARQHGVELEAVAIEPNDETSSA